MTLSQGRWNDDYEKKDEIQNVFNFDPWIFSSANNTMSIILFVSEYQLRMIYFP